MLTYHQIGTVAFIGGQFQKRYLSHHWPKLAGKLLIYKFIRNLPGTNELKWYCLDKPAQLALWRWPNVGIGRHRRDWQPTSHQRWYSVACVAAVCRHSVGARRLAYHSLPMFCVWTSDVESQVFSQINVVVQPDYRYINYIFRHHDHKRYYTSNLNKMYHFAASILFYDIAQLRFQPKATWVQQVVSTVFPGAWLRKIRQCFLLSASYHHDSSSLQSRYVCVWKMRYKRFHLFMDSEPDFWLYLRNIRRPLCVHHDLFLAARNCLHLFQRLACIMEQSVAII